jgi:LysM domain
MTRSPAVRAAGRLLKALAALAALLAVIVGVPVVLAGIGGLPHALPSVHAIADSLRNKDTTGAYFRIAGAAVVWIAWAIFTAATVKEVAASIRFHGPRPTAPRTGLARVGPAALVAMIAVLFAAAPVAGTAAQARAAAAPTFPGTPAPARSATAVQDLAQTPTAPAQHPHGQTAPAATHRDAPHPTYTVQRYDTVWRIAQHHLPGNPAQRYKDILQLNPDRIGPDYKITPGTVLALPADAYGLADTTATSAVQDVPVYRGDTLSGLASDHGIVDWRSVWPLNEDLAEPGGDHYTDPDHIEPGWTVAMPADTRPGSPAAPHSTPPTSTRPAQPPAAQRVPPPPRHHIDPPTSTRPAPPLPGEQGEQRAPVADVRARHESGLSAWNAVYFGAGALLAGGVFTTLQTLRRRQFRNRRPGRTISSAPQPLIPTEKALLMHGSTGVADVEFLDRALRSLAAATAATPGGRLPDVLAARMVADQLDLRLAEPHSSPPPAPWSVDESGCWWSVSVGDELPAAATAGEQLAPYPTLVAIGHDPATGEKWLVDLEACGALALTGDAARCLDLGRFIAAELAVNAWSDQLTATMVGFGEEMLPLNPDRLCHSDDLVAAVRQLGGDLDSAVEASASLEVDVLTGRAQGIAGDSWMPHVLLVAPAAAVSAEPVLRSVFTALRQRPTPRVGAVVLIGDQASTGTGGPARQVSIASDGTLNIPSLGLSMTAQQLPTDQVAALGALFAHATRTDDAPMPAAGGSKPYERFVDTAGALRPEFTLPRGTRGPVAPTAAPAGPISIVIRPASPETPDAGGTGWASSVLPHDDEAYLRDGATTREDLQALAPRVDEIRRAAIVAADDTLDADLAAWRDPESLTPKLVLLGPVELRAHGQRPPKRIGYYTEIAAFLATREYGATAEQIAAAFDVATATIYSRLTVVRNWLGSNPVTGGKYLPDSTQSEAGKARGLGVYECDGLLVDADLFRRLRGRGEALGEHEGIACLQAALSLVLGPPFDQAREGGYGWLADTPLHHYLTAGIVDVAHTVHLHHLHAGNLEQARTAAETALRAAPYEDTPRLDLVAVMRAAGHGEEADRYLREEICNRSDDGEAPDDLPQRTQALVRAWQSRAS